MKRQEPEEHPAPVEGLRHDPGDSRPEDPGQDPGGRERREHGWSEALGEAAPDRDIGDRRDRATADALDEASGDEHRHGHGRAGEHEPDPEQGQPENEREHHAAPVDQAPGNDDPHEGAHEKRREHEPVQLQSAEIAGNDRHGRGDGERLGGNEGDGQDEPDRERATLRRPQPVLACRHLVAGEAFGVRELFRGHALRHAIRASRRVQAAGRSRRPRPSRTGCGRPPTGARRGR